MGTKSVFVVALFLLFSFAGGASQYRINQEVRQTMLKACRDTFPGVTRIKAYEISTCMYRCLDGNIIVSGARLLANGTTCANNSSCNAGVCQLTSDVQICEQNFTGQQPITMGFPCQVLCRVSNGTTYGINRPDGTSCISQQTMMRGSCSSGVCQFGRFNNNNYNSGESEEFFIF